MTDLTAEFQPSTSDQLLDQRRVVSWVALAAGMYLASAGVVRLFDYLSARAQTAQLVQEGGPMYPTTCSGCLSTPGLLFVWLTDWRAVLVWSLAVAGAAIAVLVSRLHRVDLRR